MTHKLTCHSNTQRAAPRGLAPTSAQRPQRRGSSARRWGPAGLAIGLLMACGGEGSVAPSCGDNSCSANETCSSCASDCGVCSPPPSCGDRTCSADETCSTCPSDCDVCPPPPPNCKDGTCSADETCTNCAADCGVCPPLPSCSNGSCYYVADSGGNDGNDGSSPSTAWKTVGKVNGSPLNPGDTVLFKRGDTFSGELAQRSDGTAPDPITFGAYGSGTPPILRQLDAQGDYQTYENLIIDHNQSSSGRPVRIRNATDIVLRGVEVRNAIIHGVNIGNANNTLIEDCHFHHFLAGSFTSNPIADAHGISIDGGSNGVTVRNTHIHHVSGG